MLTTLTIIGIFMEIFASGILLAGAITFLKNYFSNKKIKDLFFGLVFFTFFGYVAATVASQLMLNLGRGLSELILVHKGISVDIVLCAFFLWAFITERFELKKLRWSYIPVLLLAAFFIYRILYSSVNLIYREGIIEPVVVFSLYVPIKPFFTLVWLILAAFSFVSALKATQGRKTLTFTLGLSALIVLGSLFCSFLYVRFGEAGYLLASWILILFSSMGFLLAELIPADSPEAKNPLRFFRTRILFKLMLIFVLLIVILFETTTLATINIGKNALSQAIINNYLRVAEELAGKIEASPAPPPFEYLYDLVSAARINGKGGCLCCG